MHSMKNINDISKNRFRDALIHEFNVLRKRFSPDDIGGQERDRFIYDDNVKGRFSTLSQRERAVADRELGELDHRLFIEAPYDIQRGDALRFRGIAYSVRWIAEPSHKEHHLEVRVRQLQPHIIVEVLLNEQIVEVTSLTGFIHVAIKVFSQMREQGYIKGELTIDIPISSIASQESHLIGDVLIFAFNNFEADIEQLSHALGDVAINIVMDGEVRQESLLRGLMGFDFEIEGITATVVEVDGFLAINVGLFSIIELSSSLQGAITNSITLFSQALQASHLTGDIISDIPLLGEISQDSLTDPSISVLFALISQAVDNASLEANLKILVALMANVSVDSFTKALLSVLFVLAVEVTTNTSVQGFLSAVKTLIGQATDDSYLMGQLEVLIALVSAVDQDSYLLGEALVRIRLFSVADEDSQTAGNLTVEIVMDAVTLQNSYAIANIVSEITLISQVEQSSFILGSLLTSIEVDLMVAMVEASYVLPDLKIDITISGSANTDVDILADLQNVVGLISNVIDASHTDAQITIDVKMEGSIEDRTATLSFLKLMQSLETELRTQETITGNVSNINGLLSSVGEFHHLVANISRERNYTVEVIQNSRTIAKATADFSLLGTATQNSRLFGDVTTELFMVGEINELHHLTSYISVDYVLTGQWEEHSYLLGDLLVLRTLEIAGEINEQSYIMPRLNIIFELSSETGANSAFLAELSREVTPSGFIATQDEATGNIKITIGLDSEVGQNSHLLGSILLDIALFVSAEQPTRLTGDVVLQLNFITDADQRTHTIATLTRERNIETTTTQQSNCITCVEWMPWIDNYREYPIQVGMETFTEYQTIAFGGTATWTGADFSVVGADAPVLIPVGGIVWDGRGWLFDDDVIMLALATGAFNEEVTIVRWDLTANEQEYFTSIALSGEGANIYTWDDIHGSGNRMILVATDTGTVPHHLVSFDGFNLSSVWNIGGNGVNDFFATHRIEVDGLDYLMWGGLNGHVRIASWDGGATPTMLVDTDTQVAGIITEMHSWYEDGKIWIACSHLTSPRFTLVSYHIQNNVFTQEATLAYPGTCWGVHTWEDINGDRLMAVAYDGGAGFNITRWDGTSLTSVVSFSMGGDGRTTHTWQDVGSEKGHRYIVVGKETTPFSYILEYYDGTLIERESGTSPSFPNSVFAIEGISPNAIDITQPVQNMYLTYGRRTGDFLTSHKYEKRTRLFADHTSVGYHALIFTPTIDGTNTSLNAGRSLDMEGKFVGYTTSTVANRVYNAIGFRIQDGVEMNCIKAEIWGTGLRVGVVIGGDTEQDTTVTQGTHGVNTTQPFWMRAQCFGVHPNITIRAKIWQVGSTEPIGWTVSATVSFNFADVGNYGLIGASTTGNKYYNGIDFYALNQCNNA